jgi:hypothetical protein
LDAANDGEDAMSGTETANEHSASAETAAAGPNELERWRRELAFRERELHCSETETDLKRDELRLKAREQAQTWKSPIVVAIGAAMVAGVANAVVSYLNNSGQSELENVKAENSRILEVIKTDDSEKAKKNLRFLLEAGLVLNEETRRRLSDYLKKQLPGEGPSLPVAVRAPVATDQRIKFSKVVALQGNAKIRLQVFGGPIARLNFGAFDSDDRLVSTSVSASTVSSGPPSELAFFVPENAHYLKWGVRAAVSAAALREFSVLVDIVDSKGTLVARSSYSGKIPAGQLSSDFVYDGICLRADCVIQQR